MNWKSPSPKKQRILLSSPCCPPGCPHNNQDCEFQVAWKINPYMDVGSVNSKKAISQHQNLRKTLEVCGADILEVPFVHGAFDSVYIKDSALIRKSAHHCRALLSRPRHAVRRAEQGPRGSSFHSQGFQVDDSEGAPFEGGDLVYDDEKAFGFLGFGFRSDPRVRTEIETFLGGSITELRLIDPRFYHLDTALGLVHTSNGTVAFAYENAFSKESWERLKSHPKLDDVVPVSESEALQFGLNWLEVSDHVILGSTVPQIQSELRSLGKRPVVTPLSEFQRGGGSVACLTARLFEAPSKWEESHPQRVAAAHPQSAFV